ncbi:MAG: zf-HC2 domain-containing protein [Planctomycetes bacterium]|nr:zf-HC2 domain-containing protein [Planctomycetota bacterium]
MTSSSLPDACRQFSPMLAGFVGEELPREQLERVQEHLRECCGCRREAADYMQANKALQGAAFAVAARDDVPFGEMHHRIMEAVEREADQLLARNEPVWGMRLMVFAAAVMLSAFGFWLAAGAQGEDEIWQRPGYSGAGTSSGPVADHVVVPYAGSPAEIRPVGLDEPGSAESGVGAGMSGRGSLRRDVEILPAVHYEQRRVR